MNPAKPVLDPVQQAFVDHIRGAALLHAPVGTGKTMCLATRAAQAIRSGFDPGRILCLTFTNRAAEELRQRVASECGDASRRMVVRTFHSLCALILRLEAKGMGLAADFMVFDDQDSLELIAEIVRRRGGMGSRKATQELAFKSSTAISRCKSLASDEQLSVFGARGAVFGSLPSVQQSLAQAYQEELIRLHAVDFDDLVFLARSALHTVPDIASRWAQRFDLVQVDEMQDTHVSEYGVIRALALASGNLALAGDYDQTIYEWRGSCPDDVLAQFHRDFPDARRFEFATNYRSTAALVDVARRVAESYTRNAGIRPCAGARPGTAPEIHIASDEAAEARWIAAKMMTSCNMERLGRVAVLARSNRRARAVSSVLSRLAIPHITVEQYEFFQRQEVKDALAYLSFLIHPADGRSFRRMLLRPKRGIGDAALSRIITAEADGLRLVDMVHESTLTEGDPFAGLLHAAARGSIVVFDTETTGLDPEIDDVIEIGAVRLEHGREVAEFHAYIPPRAGVGESYAVHGLSDEFLGREGREAAEVYAEFARFCSDAILVGHNVGFDMRMLAACTRRAGVDLRMATAYDTLDIARRFIDTEDYTLSGLVQLLGIPFDPTHRALDDVAATVELLRRLLPLIARSARGRREVVGAYIDQFRPMAAEVSSLRQGVNGLRPHELLASIVDRTGLGAHYESCKEPHRLNNIRELGRLMASRDRGFEDPIASLESFLLFASLARNIDAVDPNDRKVRVLTVHQAKGLEFDTVFLAGMNNNEFPNYFAAREGMLHEELRVFYVAVTRARDTLYLTGHHTDELGRSRLPSPYLNLMSEPTGAGVVGRTP